MLMVYGLEDRQAGLLASLLDVAQNKPVTLPVPETQEGLEKLKMPELRKILKDRVLKVGG